MQRAREEGEVPPTETGVLFVGTEGAGEALSSGFFFFFFGHVCCCVGFISCSMLAQ